MVRSAVSIYAAVLLLGAFAVYAEDLDSPEVVIEGKKYDPEKTNTASRTIIDKEKLEGERLDEALEREAGLRVIRRGGAASYSTLSIRGSNANQVRVYLDGIPLNNAVSGEVNLGDLNPQLIGQVEIHRSGSASSLAGSAIGGSVNLKIEPGDEKSVYVKGGSFRTVELGGLVSDRFESFYYGLGVSAEQSDQNFLFRNDNGTRIFNTFDDKDERRKNAQFRRLSATGKAGFQAGSTDISLLNDYYSKIEGIPGPGNNQTEKTERHHWRNTTGLTTETKGFLTDRMKLNTALYYTDLNDQFFDPEQEFSFQTPNARSRLQQFGVEVAPVVYVPEFYQTIRISATTGREIYHRDRRNRFHDKISKQPTRFRTHSGFHLEDEFSFLEDKIILTPAFRYNRYKDRFNEEKTVRNLFESDDTLTETRDYSFGARFQFFDFAALRLSGSRDTRVPLFTELFGEQGLVVPNTSLRPEVSRSYEAGLDFAFGADLIENLNSEWELSVTGFDRNIEDMILFVPNSPFSLRAENVDAASVRGAEVSARVTFNRTVFFYSNYTYQRAINQSDVAYLKGNYLALRPLHSYAGGAGFNYNGFESGLDALFTGAVFRDRSNDYNSYQPARWVYDFYFQYTVFRAAEGAGSSDQDEKDNKPDPAFTFRIDVKNIMNERIEDITGYPIPGRSVYASVRYYF